jgi:hypothetical protein
MGLLATSWKDGREERAMAVFKETAAAFDNFSGVALGPVAKADNFCLTGLVGDDNSVRLCRGFGGQSQLSVAYAGWVGWWENGRGSRATAREIAERCAQSTNDALRNLFGHYGLVIGDSRTQELIATADHPGFFPLYYAQEPGIVWISSSALCLAKALNRRLETHAALGLFLSAQVRSPRSAFDGVRRLGAGEQLTVTRGTPIFSSTWSPFTTTSEYRCIEDCADAGSDILTRTCSSIERSFNRPVFDLTGGLDSRVVVSASSNTIKRPQVFVTGPRDDLDVRISENIAEGLGWEWNYLPTPYDWADNRWNFFRKAVFLNDGEIPGHMGDRVIFGKTWLSRRFDGSITGSLGELLRDFFWQQQLTGLGKTSQLDLTHVFRYRFSANFLKLPPELFQSDLLEEYVSSEIATANTIVSKEPDSLNTMKLDALYLWKNSGHFGRFLGSSTSVLTTIAPIGLRPMVEFALSVPFRYRLRGNLIRHMITRQNNTLARYPTTYGVSAEAHSMIRIDRHIQHGLYFLSRAIKKARQIVTQNPLLSIGSGADAVTLEDKQFRMRLNDLGYLHASNLVSAPLFNAEGLEVLLNQARLGRAVSPNHLYALATIEMVCRAIDSDGAPSVSVG